MTTVGPGSRPVSESLQGRNPREISKSARLERYGDLYERTAKAANVEVVRREAPSSSECWVQSGEGRKLARVGMNW